MIVCGDFNSIPSSAAYELLYAGTVAGIHEDFAHHDYGNYTKIGLNHQLDLRSAYKEVTDEEPSYTNYTGTKSFRSFPASLTWHLTKVGDFVGALDYIWYTDTTLSCERVLQIPPEQVVLSHNGALPNPFMCSDHIPIVADLYGKLVPKPSTYRGGGLPIEGLSNSAQSGQHSNHSGNGKNNSSLPGAGRGKMNKR